MITEQNLKSAIDNWRTGHYGEDDYYDEPFVCPICGEKAYELYYNNRTSEIVGCDYCIEIKDSIDEEANNKWRI